MSEKTGIEWADSTGNPWIGCTKVSPGCKNCYAAEMDRTRFSKTMGGNHWGKGAPRVRTKGFWKDAVRWDWEAETCKCGKAKASALHDCEFGRYDVDYHTKMRRRHVFPSLCDWLDDEVPIEWLADFLKLIHDTPNLDWLLLTKRPENFTDRIFRARCYDVNQPGEFHPLYFWITNWMMHNPPENVWLGVSVEDQKRADERIPQLLQIPAKVRFLSVEPLLERVRLGLDARWCDHTQTSHDCDTKKDYLHWVIVGGESGGNRRDCGVEAICDVARQCVAAGVPCFVKQDCAFKPGQQGRIPDDVWKLKQFPK